MRFRRFRDAGALVDLGMRALFPLSSGHEVCEPLLVGDVNHGAAAKIPLALCRFAVEQMAPARLVPLELARRGSLEAFGRAFMCLHFRHDKTPEFDPLLSSSRLREACICTADPEGRPDFMRKILEKEASWMTGIENSEKFDRFRHSVVVVSLGPTFPRGGLFLGFFFFFPSASASDLDR